MCEVDILRADKRDCCTYKLRVIIQKVKQPDYGRPQKNVLTFASYFVSGLVTKNIKVDYKASKYLR